MGKVVNREITVFIDEYDTALKNYVWDVTSISSTMEELWRYSKYFTGQPILLKETYGTIRLTNVTVDPNGRLLVRGVDASSGAEFRPIAGIAPLNSAPLYFIIKPQTTQAQVSNQTTTGQNKTGPTYNVTAGLAAKFGLKIFGTGVEATPNLGVTRNGASTTNTTQQQNTATRPVEVVQRLELHRTMKLPDISMNQAALPAYA